MARSGLDQSQGQGSEHDKDQMQQKSGKVCGLGRCGLRNATAAPRKRVSDGPPSCPQAAVEVTLDDLAKALSVTSAGTLDDSGEQ